MQQDIDPSLPSIAEAINTDLTALWRDAVVCQSIMVSRDELVRRRMSDPLSGTAPPHIAHETRDDLLRSPRAAADALAARSAELPEPIEAALARRKKLKAKNGGVESVFKKAKRDGLRDLGDAAPFRARVAFRIIREHARIKNLIEDDESMIEALGIDPNQAGDPWRAATSFVPPKARDNKTRLSAAAWHSMEALQDKPLLPPSVPLEFRDTGDGPGGKGDLTILQSYSPDLDNNYIDWLDGCEMIARYLGIQEGSQNNREQGRVGLQGMFDPALARLLWPSRYEIAAVESLMIQECLTEMVNSGIPGAIKWLGDEYGLLKREAQSIIKLSKAQARDMMDSDVEDNRALMNLRLESYLARSKEALDLRAEMYALKLQATIQGLGKTKPEDILQDFVDVVTSVAGRRNAKEVLPGDDSSLDSLPSSGSDIGFFDAKEASGFQERG